MKVVHLNLPPIEPEFARGILGEIDAEVVVAQCKTGDEVVEVAADADAIIGAALGKLLTPEVLDGMPKCRIVSLWSGSTDFLDLPAFTERGITVCFGADACTDEVADHGMALMLAAGRRLFYFDNLLRERGGRFGDHDEVVAGSMPMPRLSETTVGTLGFGRAGVALATRARGFGMRFLAYDPFIPQDAGRDLGVELTTKERVLAESDFVHIYVPMKADTQKIIGEEELRLMKPTAWLVNSSARAAVIDEVALAAALRAGRLGGAALDNLAFDPESDDKTTPHPLLGVPNVIVTPHVSHVSDQSYAAMKRRVCDDVVGFFQGRWPALVANPSVKEKVNI